MPQYGKWQIKSDFSNDKKAKERKNRHTILSDTALEVLKEYGREHRPQKWLFEGVKPSRRIFTRTVEKI